MRAVSIVLVIAAHAQFGFAGESEYIGYLAHLGVKVFFGISGLLITWIMLREREATGTLSLSNFYVRRFLRIIPAYWFLLMAVSVLKLGQAISISWLDVVRALTFTHNYPYLLHPPTEYSWWLSHTWSLSVEEQFYLIWPSLFVLLPKKHAPRIAIVLALCGPVLRTISHHLVPAFRGGDGIESHFDTLMADCAAAFLLDSSAWRERIRKLPVWPTLATTSIFLLVAQPFFTITVLPHARPATVHVFYLFAITIEGAAIAITLLVLVAGAQGSAFRIINLPAARHIGKLSYSLYLWQEMFIGPGLTTGALSLAWRLAATYLTALCSFNFLERPFVRLRSRFRHGFSV